MVSAKRRSPFPPPHALGCGAPDRHRGAADDDRGPQRWRPLRPAEWLAVVTVPVLAAAWAGVAHGQAAGELTVLAEVVGSCTVNSPTINFDNYETGQSDDVERIADIMITCPSTKLVTVGLDRGMAYGDAGQDERAMKGPSNGDVLGYNLYTDAAFNSEWGDGTFGTRPSAQTVGPSGGATLVVHARLRGGQSAEPGSYSDTVAIVLEVEAN